MSQCLPGVNDTHGLWPSITKKPRCRQMITAAATHKQQNQIHANAFTALYKLGWHSSTVFCEPTINLIYANIQNSALNCSPWPSYFSYQVYRTERDKEGNSLSEKWWTTMDNNSSQWSWWYGIIGFNVPLDTISHIICHFGDNFTGHMTQPTVS